MNRRHLDALLKAGFITATQHAEHIAQLDTGSAARPTLHTHVAAHNITLDVEPDRTSEQAVTIHADVITRYDELIASHGMIIHTGALKARQPLSRVKLLRDHDHSDPVGFMTAFDGVNSADFEVSPDDADRVLREIADKKRDGLSIGISIHEYDIDDDWILHVLEADFYEVSLCAIPAVQEAGVTSVAAAMAALAPQGKEHHTMNREQLAAALAAGEITQTEHDAQLAALTAAETVTGVPASLAQEAGPEEQPATPTPGLTVTDRAMSLQQAARHIATAANSGRGPAAVTMAIADVVPADDAGQAFHREGWLGKLDEAEDATRPWIDAIGTPEQLTELKGTGWRWEEGKRPEVDESPIDTITEIPSNEIATVEDTFTAFMIAGGWGVQRSFIDFADEAFTAAFLEAIARDYRKKSNAGIRTRVLAAAQAPGATLGGTTTATGVLGILKQIRRDVNAIEGGRATRFFLGLDLWDELEDLDYDTLPLWLRSAQIGMDFSEETATMGPVRLELDATLNADQAVGFDPGALRVKERTPFQVYAENIPNKKVEVGVFSYLRLDEHDTRRIVKRTQGEVVPT